MFHARGGGGASSAGDGWETAGEGQAAGGIKFGSIEVAETRCPLFFKRHEFRPDSGGDGRYRGGPGSILELHVEIAEPARANTAGDGTRHALRHPRREDGLSASVPPCAPAANADQDPRDEGGRVVVRPGTCSWWSRAARGYGDPRPRTRGALPSTGRTAVTRGAGTPATGPQRGKSAGPAEASGRARRKRRGVYRIGIDDGRAFTDLVAVDGRGQSPWRERPRRRQDDRSASCGAHAPSPRLGCAPGALLRRTRRIVHGTTVATNALLGAGSEARASRTWRPRAPRRDPGDARGLRTLQPPHAAARRPGSPPAPAPGRAKAPAPTGAWRGSAPRARPRDRRPPARGVRRWRSYLRVSRRAARARRRCGDTAPPGALPLAYDLSISSSPAQIKEYERLRPSSAFVGPNLSLVPLAPGGRLAGGEL
jgi:hypothetical protein